MLRFSQIWYVFYLLFFFSAAFAEEDSPPLVEFNPDFLLKSAGKTISVARFAKGNPTLPGTYRIDIYVNDNWMGHTDVTFKATTSIDNASPCFDHSLLELIGIDLDKLSANAITSLKNADSTSCLALGQLVPLAKTAYDSNDLKLNISVPQIALRRNARGYVNPSLWEPGVTAGILGYNFNTYHMSGGQAPASTQSYLGLNTGINLESWYLRSNGSFTQSTGYDTHYQNIATYLQHNFPSLKSQLTIGDAFTSGNIFDSFGFRGVQLATDQRMFPDSQNGYAPVVRGVARSNAKISITQNGNLIYETTVAPGPFEIDDLYPTGFGGDLHVVVTESDGSKQSFSVPYASLVQLLRPGVTFYSVLGGKTRNNFLAETVPVGQFTIQHGFSNLFTGYSGIITAQNYAAALVGVAINTRIGAVAADLTQANTKLINLGPQNGQSVRLSYSKLLSDTDTNFSLAAYRYSSNGYYSLNEALQIQHALKHSDDLSLIYHKRNQLQLSVNQSIAGGNYGTLFISGSSQNYWNKTGYNTQYQVGYNHHYRSLSYNISLQRQKDITDDRMTTQVYFGISVPLDAETNSAIFTSSVTQGNNNHNVQGMISGTAGENDIFGYNINGSYTEHSGQGGFSSQYRSPYANFGASYSQTGRSMQTSASVSGGVIVHSGGITLAQALGDTIGIVEAKDAIGATVQGTSPGVKIDHFGYAIVPYLMPYRLNETSIDPKGLSTDIELQSTSQQVAPYAGAVVKIKFKTISGHSALISTTQINGEPVPFGADVFDVAGKNVGIAGQAGRIFVHGLTASEGMLTVKWGDARSDQCSLTYHLPMQNKKTKISLDIIEAVCK